jgi:hypothetical protein
MLSQDAQHGKGVVCTTRRIHDRRATDKGLTCRFPPLRPLFVEQTAEDGLAACGLQVLADRHVGWFFPCGYLLKRLQHYLPFWPFRAILSGLGHVEFLCRMTVPVNLFDSRLFLAERVPNP